MPSVLRVGWSGETSLHKELFCLQARATVRSSVQGHTVLASSSSLQLSNTNALSSQAGYNLSDLQKWETLLGYFKLRVTHWGRGRGHTQVVAKLRSSKSSLVSDWKVNQRGQRELSIQFPLRILQRWSYGGDKENTGKAQSPSESLEAQLSLKTRPSWS